MCSIKSANYALYKIWTSESIISYIQNVSQNTVNMYYVNSGAPARAKRAQRSTMGKKIW